MVIYKEIEQKPKYFRTSRKIKEKTILYKEPDENKRKEYKEALEKEKKEEIVFIDESGINHLSLKTLL
jgi:tRNA(Phe) wybutosine-synthesizing methylase Tyw3